MCCMPFWLNFIATSLLTQRLPLWAPIIVSRELSAISLVHFTPECHRRRVRYPRYPSLLQHSAIVNYRVQLSGVYQLARFKYSLRDCSIIFWCEGFLVNEFHREVRAPDAASGCYSNSSLVT